MGHPRRYQCGCSVSHHHQQQWDGLMSFITELQNCDTNIWYGSTGMYINCVLFMYRCNWNNLTWLDAYMRFWRNILWYLWTAVICIYESRSVCIPQFKVKHWHLYPVIFRLQLQWHFYSCLTSGGVPKKVLLPLAIFMFPGVSPYFKCGV